MTLPRRIIKRGLLVAAAFPVAFLVFSLLFPLPPLKPYSLVVEDREGRFLQAFLAQDGVWRLRISPDEIPPKLKEILLRREDRWFYYHPGVNPFAILRAVVQNVRTGHRVSGASTITMQIARMFHPGERNFLNKTVEVFRALQLEARYSKKELLEIYLSIAPLGGNVEGLRSAALLYYATPLERLNIAQLFDLILLPGPRCENLIDDVSSESHTSQRVCDICREVLVSPDGSLSTARHGRGDVQRRPSFCERRRPAPGGKIVSFSPDYCIFH